MAGSPTSTPTVDVVTDLNIYQWRRTWEDEVVPGFQAQSEYDVSVTYPPRHHDRLQQRADSGNFPEVFTTTAPEVASYIVRGQTRPVDELVTSLSDANGDLLTTHPIRGPDATHLVPHGLSMMVLNYRADIYDQLGLSVPETWQELRANARAIDESDEVDARGFAVPGVGSEPKTREDFLTWLYSAGGALWEWTDGAEDTVEVALDAEPAQAALKHMQTLAQYSPDVTTLGRTGTLSAWIQGNIAQCLFPNAALAGRIYDQQHPNAASIALATRQAAVPLRDTTLSPPTRGRVWLTGTPRFQGTNEAGATEFLRYLYAGPDRQAARDGLTAQYLPPYEGVIRSNAYPSSDIYQVEDGHFWELERQLMDEIAPAYSGDRPRTPAAWYGIQERPPDSPAICSSLVNSVVVEGGAVGAELETARSQLQARLVAGRSGGE